MKNRVVWIDMARGMCMFCVLLAHSNTNHYYFHLFYSPWFLVLFFFISGYLYKPTTFKSDLNKLFRSLVAPYFLLSFLLLFIGFDNWLALIKGNWGFLVNKLEDIVFGRNLWFIPCIIMVQFYYIILYHIFMKTTYKKALVSCLLFASVYLFRNERYYVAPYCSDIAVYACAWFIWGDIVKQWKQHESYNVFIKQIMFTKSKLFIVLSVGCYLGLTLFMNTHFEMEFHFAYNYFDNPLCFLLLSVAGGGVICNAARCYSSWYIRKLGENSLLVFAFNGKAYALFNHLYEFCSINWNTYLYCMVLSFSEGLLLIFLAFLINKFAPFLIGRHYC